MKGNGRKGPSSTWPCHTCGKNPRRPGKTNCYECHAEWFRDYCSKPENKLKLRARRLAGAAKKRGDLVPQPCEVCGSTNVEMHHDDYTHPLMVRWFCRKHHLEHDAAVKLQPQKGLFR